MPQLKTQQDIIVERLQTLQQEYIEDIEKEVGSTKASRAIQTAIIQVMDVAINTAKERIDGIS